MHVSIFLRNLLQIFENSPASEGGGLRSPDPHEAHPIKCSIRTEIRAAQLHSTLKINNSTIFGAILKQEQKSN